MDTSDEWISSRTGIRRRHITRDETTSDLGTQVVKQLLSKAGLSAVDIDFIIVATITPDSLMPSTAARIQGNIGAVNAFAMDVTAACSGFVFALSTADKFIQSGIYKRGIVIGAETLSKTLDWSDRSTSVLFGDGAGGVLLEATETKHFLAESLNTDGSRGLSLTSAKVGLSSPFSEKEEDDKFLKMMVGLSLILQSEMWLRVSRHLLKLLKFQLKILITCFCIKLIFVSWIKWREKCLLTEINF